MKLPAHVKRFFAPESRIAICWFTQSERPLGVLATLTDSQSLFLNSRLLLSSLLLPFCLLESKHGERGCC
jgi:hypothetical protein